MPTKPTGRPRGRPKGSKNIPKIEAFVEECLTTKIVKPEIPKGKPRGIWANLTPEQRSEYARQHWAKVDLSKAKPGRRKGIPQNRTIKQHEAILAREAPLIERIMKKMADLDQLPEDEQSREALKTAVTIMRTEDAAKTRLAAARLILDFTKAKPTQKIEHTVKSAEEILDEMAADD